MKDTMRKSAVHTFYPRQATGPMHTALAIGAGAAGLLAAPSAFATTYEVGPGKPYREPAGRRGVPARSRRRGRGAGGHVLRGRPRARSQSGTARAEDHHPRHPRERQARPVLSGGTNTVEFARRPLRVRGLRHHRRLLALRFHHADDITLRDTVIHDCPGQGILGRRLRTRARSRSSTSRSTLRRRRQAHQIYMATDESAHPGSVFRMQHCYVHDGNGGNNVKSRAERNEIYYNWIEGAYYHELELIGPDGQDPRLAREDSDVVGNVLPQDRSGSYVARIGGDGTGDTGGRYRFVNNTILLDRGRRARCSSCSMRSRAWRCTTTSSTGWAAAIYTDGDASWVTRQGGHRWGATTGWPAGPPRFRRPSWER